MTSLRKSISLIGALVFLLGGLGSAIYLVFFALALSKGLIFGSIFAAIVGAYWLYEDFL